MDRLTHIFVILMATLAASVGIANAGVTTVTLRATVRLAPDADVTLGTLAHIEGDQADRIASLPIPSDRISAGAWTELNAKAVRDAISASSAFEGSIVVVGQRVNLTRRAEAAATQTTNTAPAAKQAPTVVTVRDHLESWLRARFRAEPDKIRFTFQERDTDTITTPTDGRKVGVVEIGASGRIALRVTVYEDDRIVLTESIRVGVELQSPAAITERPLRRGTAVAETDVRFEPVWHDPTEPPASPDAVIGKVLSHSIDPGKMLRADHLERPVMIERGQDVSVRAVRGTIVVTTTARARNDAMMGELVELEAKDGSRRRFTARVAGPGRAVMSERTAPETDSQASTADNPTPIASTNR